LSLQNGFLKIKFENKFFHNLTFGGLILERVLKRPTLNQAQTYFKDTNFCLPTSPA
jgi:hypothetical protein